MVGSTTTMTEEPVNAETQPQGVGHRQATDTDIVDSGVTGQ